MLSQEERDRILIQNGNNRAELKPFTVVDPQSLTAAQKLACIRIYGIAKESGLLYSFMITEMNDQVKGSYRYYTQLKLEDVGEKVFGVKKNDKETVHWSAWKDKETKIFIRNTWEEILVISKEEEEEMNRAD